MQRKTHLCIQKRAKAKKWNYNWQKGPGFTYEISLIFLFITAIYYASFQRLCARGSIEKCSDPNYRPNCFEQTFVHVLTVSILIMGLASFRSSLAAHTRKLYNLSFPSSRRASRTSKKSHRGLKSRPKLIYIICESMACIRQLCCYKVIGWGSTTFR